MVKGASTVLLGRFGKPQLVKETSKIYTNNYITIPFLQMRKMASSMRKRNENELFKGVMFDEDLEA